jgi:hypothetical protein
VWSPDHTSTANVGDARDLGTVSENSDSIEVQGKLVFPSQKDAYIGFALRWSGRPTAATLLLPISFRSRDRCIDRCWSCWRRLRAESGLAGGGRRLAAAIRLFRAVGWTSDRGCPPRENRDGGHYPADHSEPNPSFPGLQPGAGLCPDPRRPQQNYEGGATRSCAGGNPGVGSHGYGLLRLAIRS